ncbi:Phenazine biosynthesis-like domain-containing protein 1,Phenazine biosynthesis-like domain-containing protein 2,Phenazine biosynthesis-like domain-containing protein [Mytilus edulis]|uniref:Phenazine biosynthesis-like domain-containing protein 1,Phenazine biosynthesis-like domain-containing protein 2,Phenazine biosynthesis-like domain-containing protein n=1 Tax=Mytilus edulis TaxID=6550 RepID=A0A8S3QT51_MYTED|nr:Phenazine biosynthesis-like domain-containing protein 1,Phenazine biosynthesis-like domain-containing protein 2,Phenazine biosynthesis-like domain-containing protein [Mytilus edulis]
MIQTERNPAAVCLVNNEKLLSEEKLQQIAAEMNLSETVYIIDTCQTGFTLGDRFRIRWFTPTNEVNLCGHATVASASVLFYQLSKQSVRQNNFDSASGPLITERAHPNGITMNFPLNPPENQDEEEIANLLQHIGTTARIHSVYICKTTHNLLIRLNDSTTRLELESLRPDTTAMMNAEPTGKVKGVIITLKGTIDNGCVDKAGEAYDFISRYFAPWNGIPEDPVTGSAHTVSGAYWSEVLQKKSLYDVGTSIEYTYKEIEYGKCSLHVNQERCWYCKDCDSFVCLKCVSETHQQHVLIDTDQIHKEKVSQVSKLIELYKRKITSIRTIKKIGQKKYEESKKKIIERKEDLTKLLDDHSKHMLYQLEEKCKTSEIGSKSEDLSKTLDLLLNCQRSKRADLLLGTLNTFQDADVHQDQTACFPRFVMGRPLSPKLIEKFGSFREETVVYPNEEIELLLKSSHITSLQMIKRIVEISDEKFYVIDESSLYCVEIKKGEKLHIKKIVDIKAVDISFDITKTKEILIAMAKEGKIMVLKPSLKMKLFFSRSGFSPSAIHITKDDKVIVGVREEGELEVSSDEDSRRQIIVFDKNGQEENVFEYDKRGNASFQRQ